MNLSYKKINSIITIISLYSSCFGMNLMTIPKEIHPLIFTTLDLTSQEHLRKTCLHWKQIDDKLNANSGVLRLLRSLHDSNKETKTRILFYAVYNDDYHLTKKILKSTPNEQLYLGPIHCFCLNPYHVAQANNNENISKLLKRYQYQNNRIDHDNKPIDLGWPQQTILQELLIAAISGDNIALNKVLHTETQTNNFFSSITKFDNLTLYADMILKNAFYFITQNDDKQCIIPCIQWIKNNPYFDYLINELIEKAFEKKSKKVAIKLLESKKDINAIEIWNINGQDTEQTIKDRLLRKPWENYRSQEYYDEAEAILNIFGAKTVEELTQKK